MDCAIGWRMLSIREDARQARGPAPDGQFVMAKLIVTWPRIQGFGDGFAGWPIRIDGKDVATIDFGKKVEIELPPGRHQVRVGGFLRSPPVDIDCGPEETHQLAVGPDTHPIYRLLFGASVVLAMLPQPRAPVLAFGPGTSATVGRLRKRLEPALGPSYGTAVVAPDPLPVLHAEPLSGPQGDPESSIGRTSRSSELTRWCQLY